MQRREFCKLVAAAAAANAIPAKTQTGAAAPMGFNTLHQTYEEFCATPEKDRVFYALVDGKIVETKLDDATWEPTDWGKSPELPGGSWDGVPMTAPISGLSGEGPYQANLGFDAAVRRAGVVSRREVRHLGALEPAVRARRRRLVCAQHVRPGPAAIASTTLSTTGRLSVFGYKDLCAQWTLLNWEPDALIQRYKDAGARFFICARESSRRV